MFYFLFESLVNFLKNLFIISFVIKLTDSVILVSGIQHRDLTVVHIQCAMLPTISVEILVNFYMRQDTVV